MIRTPSEERLLRATLFGLALLAAACGGEAPPPPNPVLESQASGTTALLQAVSVVDESVVWVSGHQATYVRTVDGGATWEAGTVPGLETLQFRDVHAVDANTAYLLSAGTGDMSRIYKTTDAGASWTLQFTNAIPTAFFDCMDFWDADHGLAYSDAVDGRLIIIRTTDGGANWNPVPQDAIPAARGSEGGFAASGTCLVVHGDRTASIGTGAGDTARVLTTTDRGDSWTAVEVPILSGSARTGITSLVFRDDVHGVAVGGDIRDSTNYTQNVVATADGGTKWTAGGQLAFAGAAYGASFVPGAGGTLVAVGPQGASYSLDDGTSWASLDTLSYWAVGFADAANGWAVGPEGRIAKIRLF
jgi:photosystem II stability/assembly factor-like uncharacterized protein